MWRVTQIDSNNGDDLLFTRGKRRHRLLVCFQQSGQPSNLSRGQQKGIEMAYNDHMLLACIYNKVESYLTSPEDSRKALEWYSLWIWESASTV